MGIQFALMALLFVAYPASALSSKMVNITVYYESLCPDSQKFIKEQLYPNFNSNLGSHMNVTLVPFGKANITKVMNGKKGHDSINITCHHKELECFGNMVHACSIHYMKEGKMLMSLINCLMSTQSPSKNDDFHVSDCLKKSKVSDDISKSINVCSTSEQGKTLLIKYGNMTNEFQHDGLKHVPTIAFNGKYNETLNSDAQKSLKKVVCTMLNDTKIEGCSSASSMIASFAVIVCALIISKF